MKKGLRIAGCLLAAALLFGCANSTNVEGGGTTTVEDKRSLTEKISDASGTVDFKGSTIAEDAVVSKKITIKNLKMDGKTLTIKSTGVELVNVENAVIILEKSSGNDAVKLTNCKNIVELTVADGSTDNLTIDASQIDSIIIENGNVKITLKDETKVAEVAVKADGTSIDSVKTSDDTDAKAPAIENIKVGNEADGVTVSGGSIEKIEVEVKDGETASAPAINITGETEIADIAAVTAEGKERKVTVNVSEEIKDKIELPEDKVEVVEIKVTGVELETKNAKKNYTIGDKFDYSGLNAILKYSNGSERTVPLTSENSRVTGFDTSAVGEYDISIKYSYADLEKNTSLKIYVRKAELTNATSDEYIQAALEKLTVGTPDYDGAVAYFKKAYESNKDSDEAKLYYALAELGSISTDDSVAKLLKENFGLKNYPATMNALFSGDWMKEYLNVKTVQTFNIKADTAGSLVRVNGKELRGHTYSYGSGSACVEYILDDENDWIEGRITEKEENSTYRHSLYIKDIEVSETGKYLISQYSVSSVAETDKYIVTPGSWKKAPLYGDLDVNSIPEFKVPEGVEKNEAYTETLYKSMQTSQTMSYLMLMNIFTCNAKGFNSLIDNCLNVFGTRYEHAKSLVASLEQESIEVPAEIIASLKLEKFFGESSVKIGKAEANVLFAAGDIIKGLFQWFSSYDLSMNIDKIPALIDEYYATEDGKITNNPNYRFGYYGGDYIDKIFNDWDDAAVQYFTYPTAGERTDPYYVNQEKQKYAQRMMETLSVIINGNTLKVRNASAMEDSKETIAGALNTVLDSYTYITVTSKSYPSGVKDMIKQYGDPISAMVDAAKDAIEKGEIFEFPSPVQAVSVEIDSEGKETVVKSDPQMLSVDFGKLFKAGYFSNVFVKDKDGNYSINMELIADLLPFLASQQQ